MKYSMKEGRLAICVAMVLHESCWLEFVRRYSDSSHCPSSDVPQDAHVPLIIGLTFTGQLQTVIPIPARIRHSDRPRRLLRLTRSAREQWRRSV